MVKRKEEDSFLEGAIVAVQTLRHTHFCYLTNCGLPVRWSSTKVTSGESLVNLHVLQFRLQQQPGLGGAEDAGEVDEQTGTAPSCVETLTLA